MGLADYSQTPSSNSAISGTNIAEGCNASGINDAIRQLMADIAAAATEGSIVAAGTTDLSTVSALRVAISGSTAITSLGTKANVRRTLRFTGAPLLTYNATSLITPTGANIQAAPGDVAEVVSDGSGNWTVIGYTPVGGVQSANATNQNLTNAPAALASVALTPGKWRLSALADFNGTFAGQYMWAVISTTANSGTAVWPTSPRVDGAINSSGVGQIAIGAIDAVLTTSTTYYLNVSSNGAATGGLNVLLRAERII